MTPLKTPRRSRKFMLSNTDQILAQIAANETVFNIPAHTAIQGRQTLHVDIRSEI